MEKYTKSYTITSYECDSTRKLRLRTIFNFFQDLADDHANEMGLGYHECIKRGIGWIGGAYHVEFLDLPKWEDKITLDTWPSGKTAATGIRDFQMKDAMGNPIINATSQWVLVDLNRMRPVPIVKHLGEYDLVEDRAFESCFQNINAIERVDFEKCLTVRYDDIDLYKHVNNAVYPTLIYDGLPPEFVQRYQLKELQIIFKKPALITDEICIKTQIEDNRTIHQLFNKTGEVEFARIQVLWK